jgi:hypothetical protein
VGKEVDVVAALVPAQAGTSYKLDWGDGSPVEMISDSASHHYTKAKLYKVSASAIVGDSELNHEIVLNVTPSIVPPLVAGMLALLGACAFAGTPHLFRPTVTMVGRLGTPGVPEMRLLTRKPYASLSFVPGVKPAEERFSFLKRRKSGSEQS